MTPSAWLARVRHDLVKRLLWPARDRDELGGAPIAGELVPQLVDGEGAPIGAAALWAILRADAPPGLAVAVQAFEAALGRALVAADAGDVAGVLVLEADVDALARTVQALARPLKDEGR